MSLADKIFVNMCRDIITNGTSTEGQEVRPHWEDGTPAFTIKQFGVVNRYDLRKEFPAITLRKTYIKSAIDEILWIYQKKSNNIHDLNSHIWDEWADETGSIGKAYGYQVGKKSWYCMGNTYYDMNEDYTTKFITPDKKIVKGEMEGKIYLAMDQMDAVLYDLKNTPFSRRIMTNLYNFDDLHEMNLYPCAYSCTFNVTDEGYDKLVLNMILNQRSQDILAANNWNVVQYAALLMMVAQVSDMIPGQLVHVITDAHIYDRHIPIVKDLIQREQFDAPCVTLDDTITNFYDFTPDSFVVSHYETGEQIKNIPIAI